MALKGCVPWNKGRRLARSWCFRHAEERVRTPGNGTLYCRSCKLQATIVWNARHPRKVEAARRRWAKKTGRTR